MRTVYQVRHSFNFKDDAGSETFFTRANEHRLVDVVGEEGLQEYIDAGSVLKMEVPDDFAYRAPGEPAEPGEEGGKLPGVLEAEQAEALTEGVTLPPKKRSHKKR